MLFIVCGFSESLGAADNLTAVVEVTGKIVAHTCDFDSPSYNVTLENIEASDFVDNSIKKPESIDIQMTCISDLDSVKIKVTGEVDGTDKTAFANKGTATNVALRLLDNEQKTLQSGDSVKTALAQGKGNYTFKVGYVSTGADNVYEGTFSSVLSLTFDYN